MTVKTRTKKTTRRQHSPEYREEALAFAEKVDIRETARQIGLHDSQLYSWRSKARAKREQSDLEQSLAAENARLKRTLAGQEEELSIVKKAIVDSIGHCNRCSRILICGGLLDEAYI